ncbi:hypothetical protein NP233_g5401 [Leucocoprinus birnbaumii]|uniref:Uncharacterized protein n=1 Tax=Leucocoprinus birnbaumii TaxID=56174 RepID=A0AAD5VVK1_9AGAR|nr:hypothetical protein NP233_g5401 [Leucocoprinus birnbaumii]
MAASMFMNSNSLPVAIMQSLVVTVPELRWDDEDNKDTMLGRALTYLVMYGTLGTALRWSYGVRLLSQSDQEVEETATGERLLLLDDFDHGQNRPRAMSFSSDSSTSDEDEPWTSWPATRSRAHRTRPIPFRQRTSPFSLSHTMSNQHDLLTFSDRVEETDLPNSNQPPHSRLINPIPRRVTRLWAAFNNFMTAPLWAALASLIVAFIAPLQQWLQFHALAVTGAISSAGKCSIPITLVVLGAYFHSEASEIKIDTLVDISTPSTTSRSEPSRRLSLQSIRSFFARGPRSSTLQNPRAGETKTTILAILSRMILTPMVLIPFVLLSAKYGFHTIFEDPVFVVANVLLLGSPPALALAQITQAVSGDAFERLISRTIFWSYCVVAPFTSIICVLIGLALAKL